MGSKWRNKEEWQLLLARQAQSGLSVSQFCKDEGLTESAFYNRKSSLKKAAANFAQIKLEKPSPLVTRCRLPNGIEVEFEQAQPLSQLMKLLGALL